MMSSSSSHPQVARSAPSGRPTGTTSSAAAADATTSSSSYKPREDLGKTWRTLANCLIMASQTADKAAKSLLPPGSASGQQQQQQQQAQQPQKSTIDRDTDKYVISYLQTRVKWGRYLSHLEAELEGRAQELQSLQHYHRSMPRCPPPRKRQKVEEQAVDATYLAAVAAAAAVPPSEEETANAVTGIVPETEA